VEVEMNTSNEYSGQGRIGSDDVGMREGRVARAIERRTSKLPSDIFLWAAGAAIAGSLVMQIVGMKRRSSVSGFFSGLRGPMRSSAQPAPASSFIGMWVPTLLLFGLYNKIVKVAGSDRYDVGV
jgi:hypothetical protein